jgi:glycosyltransferase involved in cell wall biosynthesis
LASEQSLKKNCPAPKLSLSNRQRGSAIHPNTHLQTRILFYPAQFWAHKNHLNLINAVKLLATTEESTDITYELHLTGSDQGNESFIREHVHSLGLSQKVFFHGFVDQAEISDLYDLAFALTYPSLLGPDNLPPLEAMSRGCPVATADIEGAREVYGDSAAYFDPLDATSIANAIESLAFEKPRLATIENGKTLAASRTTKNYVEIIFKEIQLFEKYRKLFKI